MICLKCRAEIEDLSMYCPRCGAPQFAPKHEEEITLELSDPMKAKVVITEVDNMTYALAKLKDITGRSIMELRALLKELPAAVMEHLSEEDALTKAKLLQEAGLKAEALSGAVSLSDQEED